MTSVTSRGRAPASRDGAPRRRGVAGGPAGTRPAHSAHAGARPPADWGSALTPRLAHFAAVARHEHVTRAAQELGVPQSTLSRGLARLEEDLGVALFARHGRAVSLTPAGRTFLESAERALAAVEQAAESVRADADPATGKVAFGFLHTLGWETVPGLLRAFRADHPRVRFSLVQTYGEAMLERLAAGELDLCLTSPIPDPAELAARGLAARRLDEQRLRLVVPDDHRLASRRRIRLAEAAEEPFVTLEPGYGMRRILEALCTQAGFRPRIAFEGEEAETIRGLVAAGLGVALLPPPAIPRPGVHELTVTAPRASREIGLAWRDGAPETAPVAAFRRFLLSRRGSLLD
ncbi:LysR family transcriptional regulator [Streptomyces sp. JJ36]|uniref:LysR family transcriptional regulator n=1 Tax=Streptomyces sp. JJ36 TaxID=2736645 RepID=UPI001F3EBC06|nr:LysR family transcriptional regulator [Streptomyces sp. JJ36]